MKIYESVLVPPPLGSKVKEERSSDEDGFSITHLLKTPSDILSGTISEKSSGGGSSSEKGTISSSDGNSSVDSVTITQGLYDSLTDSSDSWKDEADVLAAMQNLSLKGAKVTINSKLLASVVWKARPPLYDVKELQQAQVKNFEMAQKDMEKRLSSLRSTESKKIQAPRQELKKLIGEYEEKIRVLNLRLQAGDALQGDSNDITSQVEAALEEAHEENRALKDKIKGYEAVLNDVFRTGAPLKDDCNPAKSSSRESSASMASVKSEVSRRNKRDLSPPSKQANEDFEFKKPRPRNQVWFEWNQGGNRAASEYSTGPVRTLIHTSVKAELENLILRIQAALDDFRAMYPRDPEPDQMSPEQNSKMRDAERHPRYARLQSELFIPTIEQGRRYALSFYYGKVIGSIRDALRARDQFHIGPHNPAKISTYIEFLGANHPEVKEFILYDKNTRHIENNTEILKEMFHKEYLLAGTSPKRAWLYEALFRKIQNKAQLERSARDLLYDQAKVAYCDYYYHLYLHCRINFYSNARNHCAKQ